jgi:hypothetical protein
MKKLFAAMASLLLSAAAAQASLSETTYNEYNQTTSIPAYQLFKAESPYHGNYQISVALNGNPDACEDGVAVVISWTDEQGAESRQISINDKQNGAGAPCNVNLATQANVFAIHNMPNTPVYVTVTLGTGGGSTPIYNLSVDALGFW